MTLKEHRTSVHLLPKNVCFDLKNSLKYSYIVRLNSTKIKRIQRVPRKMCILPLTLGKNSERDKIFCKNNSCNINPMLGIATLEKFLNEVRVKSPGIQKGFSYIFNNILLLFNRSITQEKNGVMKFQN